MRRQRINFVMKKKYVGGNRVRRKVISILFVMFLITLMGLPMFAAEANPAAQSSGGISAGLGYLAAALGMGLAAGLCGLGQGKAIVSACEGVSRNPGSEKAIRFFLILGLAFIESLVLYTFLIVIIKI